MCNKIVLLHIHNGFGVLYQYLFFSLSLSLIYTDYDLAFHLKLLILDGTSLRHVQQILYIAHSSIDEQNSVCLAGFVETVSHTETHTHT